MKIFMIIGMVAVFSTSCLAQAKVLAAAIEERQMVTVSLTKDQSKLQTHDENSRWVESSMMCKALKDEMLSLLLKDGYKARLGFILSETKGECTFTSKNTEIYSVTNPTGTSYIVVLERKEGTQQVSTMLFCDLEKDWQLLFKQTYGFDYYQNQAN